MNTFDPETFKYKLEITEAAVDLYVEQHGTFSFNQVAGKTGLDVADIFDYFPNKRAILQFYYTSLVIRYRLMIEEIEDFDDYLLGEKLSNFIYSTFDMMNEHSEFVEQTFSKLVYYSYSKTEFENETEALFREFFTSDDRISGSSSFLLNDYFYAFLRKKYLYLVHFWITDDSEDGELSMAWTDKLTGFVQELFYSAVLDKGYDLITFMVQHNLFVRNMPVVRSFLNKFEIRD